MRISFFCGKFGKSVQKKNGLGYNMKMIEFTDYHDKYRIYVMKDC